MLAESAQLPRVVFLLLIGTADGEPMCWRDVDNQENSSGEN